jgi:hypothetical protein
VKLEIINNFVGICRGFLSFEEEKEFDWIAGGKSVEIFNGEERSPRRTLRFTKEALYRWGHPG